MASLEFEVVGKPQPAGSKKAIPMSRNWQTQPGVRWSVIDANDKAKAWKDLVATTALGALLSKRMQRESLRGPLYLRLTFVVARPKGHFVGDGVTLSAEGLRHPYPTSKPDVLKLARGVEDALTDVVYHDDSQIVSEHLGKEYGHVEGVRVFVSEIESMSEGIAYADS